MSGVRYILQCVGLGTVAAFVAFVVLRALQYRRQRREERAADRWPDVDEWQTLFERTPAYDDTARKYPGIAAWLECRNSDLDAEWIAQDES